ncbi:MAG: ABC transporter ATP-binding protein [Bacteroidales bacterium]
MTAYAIKTEQLSYAYGKGKQVVHDLDLRVEKGKIYSFLGPNGAGKSTTIKLLLGLLQAKHGKIEIMALDSSGRLAINREIGVLVESPGLYEHLSGKRNLEIQADLRGVEKARISEVLLQVGMKDAGRDKVKTYSTGMKQRLGLAAAMLQKPKLLILDEPTNGLDPRGIREIRDLLIDMNRALGITIFLSTHLLSEAERVSHQVGIIQQGKLVFQGNKNELQSLRSSARVVMVTTNNNEKAQSMLNKAYKIQSREDGYLLVNCETETEIAKIIRMLVEKGLEVYHASVVREDLEEMFLNLTNNRKE